MKLVEITEASEEASEEEASEKEEEEEASISSSSPLELVVETTTWQLDSLKPRQKYRIFVTANTKAGEGVENFVEETSTVLFAPDVPTLILL